MAETQLVTEIGVDDWCWQWEISSINLLPGLLKYSVMDRPGQSLLLEGGSKAFTGSAKTFGSVPFEADEILR